ncbi:MAG: hypothetical protein KQI78_12170 [Deltaproteobacteria bacterium]|nr:hypothetical protein [Deltaproteobacteria bacterium]
MGYDIEDARSDEYWDQITEELYPEFKEQAIEEFTTERLQSIYLKAPDILSPGIRMYVEARKLKDNHPSAAVVFAASAIELFLKSSLLKPVVNGLVHIETLAELVAKVALGSTGFIRYRKLLSGLFSEIACIDINTIKRSGSKKLILDEASEVQDKRNLIIHKGLEVDNNDAKFAINVAYGVLHQIVNPMLLAIGLEMDSKGIVLERKFNRLF